jgi:hypothetical protein
MAQPTSFPDPPIRSPFLEKNGQVSFVWIQWFQAVTSNLIAPIVVTSAFPSNSPGQPGQIATDGTYIYQCVAKNTWKRSALTAF